LVSTDSAEFFCSSEITATLSCCQHIWPEVEPVHEPPVQERTEIQIDEILVSKIKVCQLEHSEELQSDDFSAENREEKESVARVPDYISHGLVIFGILAFFKGVLNDRTEKLLVLYDVSMRSEHP
jgi:hypothetical protein